VTAEVWGSTWVPSPCPIEGVGDDAGYAVAWVRAADGRMLQVVVDAAAAPAPGVVGAVTTRAVADETIEVFTPAQGAGA
jgi:hypothetical protein